MKKDSSPARHENLTFRALYLIAIVLVVDGHTTLDDLFGMGDLFRYYSFHLMLFAFGAGYFFKFHGGVLADLGAIVSEDIAGGIRKTVSDGSARFVGVRLGDTALWRENSAIRDKLPEDTVICLMMPTVLGDTDDSGYQHAIDYVKSLLT